MNEREELTAIIEQAVAPARPLTHDEMHAKIERGFLQSERGEVVDGEMFADSLLAELDDLVRKRRAG